MQITTIIWAVILIAASGGIIFAYRLGLRDGQRLAGGREIQSIRTPKGRRQTLTDAERKRQIELANLLSYTGDSTGQKDVM